MIDTGSDFSGVGAFEQALMRLGVEHNTIYACDFDKYARQSFIANYGEPDYFPENVYDREIPEKPLTIYMTSPPCQSFSLAGKRKGEDSENGVLFYNSHEFIQKNKPKYFIFENVKGLLSDDGGKTFQRWVDYLGGKSVNGSPVIFPHEESVPYHVYYKVLNAKEHGIPQNRERIFIIGIRDDEDNHFRFPKTVHLEKRLKDVLEENVDEKYYMSDTAIKGFMRHADRHNDKGTGFAWKPKDENDTANALRANGALCPTDNTIQVKSATKKGYEVAGPEDSINFSVPGSETRRGRVGKGVAQTLDTACNQGVIIQKSHDYREDGSLRTYKEYGPALRANMGDNHPMVMISKIGRSEEGKKARKESMRKGKDHTPFQAKEMSFEESDVMNTVLTSPAKDNLIGVPDVEVGTWRTHKDGQGFRKMQDDNCPTIPARAREDGSGQPVIKISDIDNPLKDKTKYGWHFEQNVYSEDSNCTRSIMAGQGSGSRAKILKQGYVIRRLTPRECFRLMDFPDSYEIVVSDTQAYKQAGNSICVGVLVELLRKLLKL